MERRRFTREFKLEAVRLIRERGVAHAQASRDLGVCTPPVMGHFIIEFRGLVSLPPTLDRLKL